MLLNIYRDRYFKFFDCSPHVGRSGVRLLVKPWQHNNRQSYYKVLTKCLLKYQYLYFVMFWSENVPCFYELSTLSTYFYLYSPWYCKSYLQYLYSYSQWLSSNFPDTISTFHVFFSIVNLLIIDFNIRNASRTMD